MVKSVISFPFPFVLAPGVGACWTERCETHMFSVELQQLLEETLTPHLHRPLHRRTPQKLSVRIHRDQRPENVQQREEQQSERRRRREEKQVEPQREGQWAGTRREWLSSLVGFFPQPRSPQQSGRSLAQPCINQSQETSC